MTPYQKIEDQGYDSVEIERTLKGLYEKFGKQGYGIYEEVVQVVAILEKGFELSKFYFAQAPESMDDVILDLIEFSWNEFVILN